MKEYFEVVDKNDKVIGRAPRSECHKNPNMIHRGILVIVTNSKGMILLQKRSMKKDLYPGLWGLSVGGHNRPGESYVHAAKREMKEELGTLAQMKEISKMIIRQKTETEIDMIFEARIPMRKIKFNRREIDEVKFFTYDEIIRLGEKLIPDVITVLNFYLKFK